MSEHDEDLWRLPTSWHWATLTDVADVIGGGTPATNDPDNFGGTVPWITPADMSTHLGKVISHGARWISEKGLVNSGARWLPRGSILFSSRAPIGYVAIASQPVTTNQGFKSFVPKHGITSDFVYYWLTSAKTVAEKLASGTTFLEISGAKAGLIPFPVAPTAEQTRIVEKLEELLSDLDAGVAELKAAQRKLAQYRQALLKAAVEGALSAEWRAAQTDKQETGAQLLARILNERRRRWEEKQLAKFQQQGKTPPKGWRDKYPEPVQPDTTDLPALPEGWVWAGLDQLVGMSSYGTSMKCSYECDGVPVLRIPNIVERRLDMRNLKFATQPLGLEQADHLASGDILVVRTNGSISLVGRAAEVVEPLPGNFYFASYLLRLRCVESETFPSWISAFLASSTGRNWIESRAASSAGQHNISLSTLLSMPIPVAPSSEQSESLGMLDAQLLNVAEQEKATVMSIKQSFAQRQNLLKAAFSGQLVPQDPDDEPASALLERIRAERATAAKQTGSRKTRNARQAQ